MQTIPIRVDENGGSVSLSVSGGENVEMTSEQARVIEAVSPTVDAERVEGGVEITIHDVRGSSTVRVNDGQRGADGTPGEQGSEGPPGADGKDGNDGAPGQGVPVGGTAGQVLAKASGSDYDSVWIDPPQGGPYIQTGKEAFDAAVKSGYGDLEITFPVSFKSETTPHVMVCLSAGTITNTNAANVSLWVMSRTVSESGFTVRFFNSSVTNITPTVNWIAIGEKG